MSGNNTAAPEIERLGVRTFSTREMAFNILGLVHPRICRIASSQPIWADLNGGMSCTQGIGGIVGNARQSIQRQSTLQQALWREYALDNAALSQPLLIQPASVQNTALLAKPKYHFPAPRQYEQLEHLRHLQGMVNLDKVVVVTGYGEV
ncbi:fatty acid synthase alpha subunit Lsd1, partial [Coemansia sp. BCRC 34301]